MSQFKMNGSNGKDTDHSFSESPEDLVIPESLEGLPTDDPHDQLLSQFHIRPELFEIEGSSDGSNGKFRKHPCKYEHPLWNLGWTDGRLGQPKETNEAFLLARGKLRREQRIQETVRKITLNAMRLEDFGERLARLEERLRDSTKRYYDIVRERTGRYHEFSYSLAFFYLLIAIVLFLSDVPLTLKLVAKGFDLKTEVRDPISHKVLYGVDELFVRPLDVVIQLWQPLTLAFGIALAGVFIKLFLDDVIFHSASDRPKKITPTLSIIMVVLFLTIFGLGMFRARIQAQLQDQETQATAASIRSRLKGTPEAEITKIIEGLPQTKEDWLTVATFVALTITLPLIAGACFSAGWRRLKDTELHRQTKREMGRLERELMEQNEQLVFAKAEVESGTAWLERARSEQTSIDPETEQELNLYRHGYFRGSALPETLEYGLTLHNRVQKSTEKILAKKLRQKIWEDMKVELQVPKA